MSIGHFLDEAKPPTGDPPGRLGALSPSHCIHLDVSTQLPPNLNQPDGSFLFLVGLLHVGLGTSPSPNLAHRSAGRGPTGGLPTNSIIRSLLLLPHCTHLGTNDVNTAEKLGSGWTFPTSTKCFRPFGRRFLPCVTRILSLRGEEGYLLLVLEEEVVLGLAQRHGRRGDHVVVRRAALAHALALQALHDVGGGARAP